MTSLFIDRRNTELALESGAIVFRENGERIGTIPIAPLTRVFLRGDVRLPAALLGKLGEQNVGVVILSGRQGKPTLLLARPHNDASRRVAQIRQSLDEGFCLDAAKDLIRRKIANQVVWFEDCRQKDAESRYEITHAMQLLMAQGERIKEVGQIGSLRGLEGAAAAMYFEGLKALVPESLHFKNRNRRPPKDPFNAVLSLTYTLLHAELAIALYGVGLDPYVGFYHQLDFGRESLASDLLEPLRPMADRFALQLFRKQTLRADDFSKDETACLLAKAGRVRYYTAYEGESENFRSSIHNEVEEILKRIEKSAEKVSAVSDVEQLK